jgi:Ni/Co efflux regulator RcnB
MKTKLALALCAALVLSSSAFAQQDDHRGGDDQHQRNAVMHDRGSHEGWYKKGGTMPPEYRDNRYVVSDWRSEHLREPPRGYNWVRSDNGDFLLVAITTGVITGIMLSH